MEDNTRSFMEDNSGSGGGGGAPLPSTIRTSEKEVKYKGVRKRKWGKWVSEIRLPNSRERIWLGSYNSPEKAARAFDAASFCLRGPNANFNFNDSPPVDIAAGGRSLMPDQIQAIASEYANKERQLHTPDMENNQRISHVTEREVTSAALNSDNVAEMDNFDWSILEMLEPLGTNITTIQDYSMISGLDDLHGYNCTEAILGSPDHNTYNGDHDHDDGNGGRYSFLWNF